MGLSQKLLLATIFALPLQLNKFFFTQSAYVFGIPIDYLAPSIYLTDLLIISYIVASTYSHRIQEIKSHLSRHRNLFICLLVLNLYFLSTTLINQHAVSAVFKSLKIFEISLFFFFATLDIKNEKFRQSLKLPLFFAVSLQFLIVLVQFITQKSTGLWFLGERSFDITTSSIAHSYLFGIQLLRPYGTFPHPNVLAAFFIVYQLIYLITQDSTQVKKSITSKIFFLTSFISIVLTFSKTAIFLELLFIIFLTKKFKAMILLIPLLVYVLYNSTKQPQFVNSVAERLTLISASLDISTINPLIGVGSNNFISELAKKNILSIGEVRLLQPVHNVFFLILSENGVLGLLLVVILLFFVQQNIHSFYKFLLFSTIIVYFLIDHFLWTLHQGLLILFLSLSILLQTAKKQSA